MKAIFYKLYTIINDRYIGKDFSQLICTFVSTNKHQDSAYNILITKSLVNVLLLLQLEL